jgi:hypothetical protein
MKISILDDYQFIRQIRLPRSTGLSNSMPRDGTPRSSWNHGFRVCRSYLTIVPPAKGRISLC